MKSYSFPAITNACLIDFDSEEHMSFLYEIMGEEDPSMVGDISTLINDSIPKLKDLGFDCVIIHGDTGSGVEGPPVEVIII